MSTLATLRQDLRTELKIDPSGKIWSDATLNGYINEAYKRLQKDGNYSWQENQANYTFSSVSGTQEYALPTDFIRLALIRFDGANLIKRDKISLKREKSTFTTSNKPNNYYIYGNNIGFDPIPSAVKTVDLDYLKKLTALSADTDTLAFNDDFDIAIIKYAAYLAWNSPRGNRQTSLEKLEDYNNELNTLLNSYLWLDDNNFRLRNERVSTDYIRSDVIYR